MWIVAPMVSCCPPDWDSQGVFFLRADPLDNLVVVHRYTQACRPLPAPLRLTTPDGRVIPTSKLHIQQNNFEETAKIASAMTLKTFRIGNLGSFDVAPEPLQKKLKALPPPPSDSSGCGPDLMALADGSVAGDSMSGMSTPAASSAQSAKSATSGAIPRPRVRSSSLLHRALAPSPAGDVALPESGAPKVSVDSAEGTGRPSVPAAASLAPASEVVATPQDDDGALADSQDFAAPDEEGGADPSSPVAEAPTEAGEGASVS